MAKFPTVTIAPESKIENIPMNPDVKSIAEKILDQNAQILAMNSELMEMLRFPRFSVVWSKPDNDSD